ncbi:hypothetical protein EniLVp02_0169 [Vibrio phage EniLVp02]
MLNFLDATRGVVLLHRCNSTSFPPNRPVQNETIGNTD